MRARTDTAEITAGIMTDLDTLRPHVTADPALLDAWAGVETFIAVGLRVMAKTNPSKVRDEARTVEIQVLMNKE